MTCHKKRSQKNGYFIDPLKCPKIVQMEGLETTILTGLRGEKMMMVLNATLPGHSVPSHLHSHEQIGMVYAGKAILKIGDEERLVKKGDFYCIPSNVPTATPPSATNLSSCWISSIQSAKTLRKKWVPQTHKLSLFS